MKRNLYCFIIMLFILSACSQPRVALQAATATEGVTVIIEPTPTEKPSPTSIPGIRIETDPSVELDKLPVVTYEDFISGKVIEAERKYLETHNPFNGNEIWPDSFFVGRINRDQIGKRIFFQKNHPLEQTYEKDPYLFPARSVFFFKINLPKNFFPFPTKPASDTYNANLNDFDYLLVGQVWLNPNAKPDNPSDKYRILNYLVQDSCGHHIPGDIVKTFLPLPIYYMDVKGIESNNKYIGSCGVTFPKEIYQKFYKDDIPVKYFDEWIKTNKIPKELESLILPEWGFKFN